MTSCLSPHLASPQASCVYLDWYPARADGRPRAIAWTCDCRGVYDELCEAGGLGFIRRVAKVGQGVVAETHRVRVGESHVMWAALLSGMMR